MTKQRARSMEEKLQREKKIVEAALRLLMEKGYTNISMSDVARAAGLAKGTVYLYFATREELFLSVFQQQVRAWFDVLQATLAAQTAPAENKVLARLVADSLANRPHLTRLAALNSIILEYNVTYEAVREHKLWLYAQADRLAAQFARLLPDMSSAGGTQLVLHIFMLVVGVESVAHPAPVAKQVIEQEPSLPHCAFGDEFYRLLLAVLESHK